MRSVYKTLLAIVLAACAFAAQAAGGGWLQDSQKGDSRNALEGATDAVNPTTTPRRARNDRRDRVRESDRRATPASSAPDRIKRNREARRAGASSRRNAQRQIKRGTRAGESRNISRERRRSR